MSGRTRSGKVFTPQHLAEAIVCDVDVADLLELRIAELESREDSVESDADLEEVPESLVCYNTTSSATIPLNLLSRPRPPHCHLIPTYFLVHLTSLTHPARPTLVRLPLIAPRIQAVRTTQNAAPRSAVTGHGRTLTTRSARRTKPHTSNTAAKLWNHPLFLTPMSPNYRSTPLGLAVRGVILRATHALPQSWGRPLAFGTSISAQTKGLFQWWIVTGVWPFC